MLKRVILEVFVGILLFVISIFCCYVTRLRWYFEVCFTNAFLWKLHSGWFL